MPDKMFPILASRKEKPSPRSIPWSIAELAYSVYVASYGGSGQSLERVAERGGFYSDEMDLFLPDWRERCSEIEALKIQVAQLQETINGLKDILACKICTYCWSNLVGEGPVKDREGEEDHA